MVFEMKEPLLSLPDGQELARWFWGTDEALLCSTTRLSHAAEIIVLVSFGLPPPETTLDDA